MAFTSENSVTNFGQNRSLTVAAQQAGFRAATVREWFAAAMHIAAALSLTVATARGADIKFQVRHDHLRKGCAGTMTVDEKGIYFHGPKDHVWSWEFQDIQELKLAPDHIHLQTYRDDKWKLGADREFDFSGKIPSELYAIWKDRLDARFVAEVADPQVKPLWQVPAKHLGRITGSEGMLEIGDDRIVYKTDRKDDSRTWRLSDIENISSTNAFDFTVTTREKEFRFQLKQVLSQARYNELWRKLNDMKGKEQ